MKKFKTLFSFGKAKRLLSWNLGIKAKQRGVYLMVEDAEYDQALKLIREKEQSQLQPYLLDLVDED